MKVRLTPAKLCGSIPAISSKSDAHRLLIAAALSDRETGIICNVLSEDIRATARCLCALGARVDFLADRMLVHPIPRENTAKEVSVTLDCGESGSTLRFLLPVVSALGKNGVFTGGGRLPERPVTELREAMEAHGVRFSEQGVFPISTIGKLGIGTYTLRGDVSSQYVTGLLFALPLLPENSVLRLLPPVESKPYIEMTMATLKRFRIRIFFTGGEFWIPGGQTYKSPGTVSVEGDWSNAAFWLCAGALGKEPLTVRGLSPRSVQGDRNITAALVLFGAKIVRGADSVTVRPDRLHGIKLSAKDIPDLVPVISAVAACAEGRTVIEDCARLRIKESDRMATTTEMLRALGADIRIEGDSLVIDGKPSLTGGTVQAHNDHRIAMTAAVAAVRAEGPVIIEGAEAVAKSYPAFFDDYRKLGGDVRTQEAI